MSEDAPAPLGTIAHYTLLEQLDPAGPGVVYRARIQRRAAPWPSACCGRFPRRLRPPRYAARESRALTALSHANVIALFDAGQHDGRTYLVFEYLKADRCAPRWAAAP
jgi:hypothetical protein